MENLLDKAEGIGHGDQHSEVEKEMETLFNNEGNGGKGAGTHRHRKSVGGNGNGARGRKGKGVSGQKNDDNKHGVMTDWSVVS